MTRKMVYVNSKQHLFKKYRVINFHNKTFLGKSIQSVTNSYWNHSAVIVDVDKDKITTIESLAKGPQKIERTRAELETRYENREIEVLDFKINENQSNTLAESYIGKFGYGYESLPILLLKRLGIPIPIHLAKTLICSEFVSRALFDLSEKKIKMGFNPDNFGWAEYNKPFDQIVPGDISLSHYGDRVVYREYLLGYTDYTRGLKKP